MNKLIFDNISTLEKSLDWYQKMQKECLRSYPLPVAVYDGAKLPIAVDIGANVGGFCIPNSHLFDVIYAFEPYKPNLHLITAALKHLNIKNVKVFSQAVHSKSGETLRLRTPNFTCSGDITCLTKEGFKEVGETCDTISLDSIMKILKIEKIDYLKMDCEGSEYDILENFDNLDKVDVLGLEIHGASILKRKVDLLKQIEKTHDIFITASRRATSEYGWTFFPVVELLENAPEIFDKHIHHLSNILAIHKTRMNLDLFHPDMIIR